MTDIPATGPALADASPQYGASVAELASRSAGAVSLCIPLEAGGEEWFEFAYGDDWQRHAGFFAAGHPEVLVRDNPRLNPGLHHHCTAGEARRRISDAYLGYGQYYLSARDGMLASEPDPEFW